jgi:signal transduction histidine kinase
MPAADYQHKVEERVLHARERLETRIVRRKLTAERAKEARNRFELSVIEVRKVTADAASDGQITRDEARRVNQSTRALARAVARAR